MSPTETRCFNRFLLEAGLIVFLNKQDLLESKVTRGNTIARYFPQYEQFEAPGNEYNKTKLFIKNLFVVSFKNIFFTYQQKIMILKFNKFLL